MVWYGMSLYILKWKEILICKVRFWISFWDKWQYRKENATVFGIHAAGLLKKLSLFYPPHRGVKSIQLSMFLQTVFRFQRIKTKLLDPCFLLWNLYFKFKLKKVHTPWKCDHIINSIAEPCHALVTRFVTIQMSHSTRIYTGANLELGSAE